MKNHFTSVIFDFDYTLADSSCGEVECVNYALRAMNLPPAANSDIHAMIGVSLPETFRRLTREANQTRSDKFVELFIRRADEVMLDYVVLFDSVRPAVKQLIANGLTLGIVSTKYHRRIEAFLKREKLTDAFNIIVGGEDVTTHKPDPTGLLMALEKLGHSSAQTVYVGDTSWTRKRLNGLMWPLWRFFPESPQKKHSVTILHWQLSIICIRCRLCLINKK